MTDHPTLADLADDPGLCAAAVRRLWGECGRANGGGGMTWRRYRLIAAAIVAECERMGIDSDVWQASVWVSVRGFEG